MVQLLVGGALTAGFRLTNRLLGGTPKESVERQAQAAQAKMKAGIIDIEAKVRISRADVLWTAGWLCTESLPQCI